MRVLTKDDLKCPTSSKRMFVNNDEAEQAMRLAWEKPDRPNPHNRMPPQNVRVPRLRVVAPVEQAGRTGVERRGVARTPPPVSQPP